MGREWNSMLYESTNSSACVPKYSTTYIHTTHSQHKVAKISWITTQGMTMGPWLSIIKPIPGPQSKLQWFRDIDSSSSISWPSCGWNMPIEHNSALTTLHRQVPLTRSLWQGRSDRLFWQVALTSTSYSSNKRSANFVWRTLTTYFPIDPGTLAVMNLIWDTSRLQGRTKPSSAAIVGIWGPNHKPTRTTTRRDMRHPTPNWVSYLFTVLRYLLPYIGELHCKSHRPPTMPNFMMLYYCNAIFESLGLHFVHPQVRSAAVAHGAPVERFGWSCQSTPFVTLSAPLTHIAVKTILCRIEINLCGGIHTARSQSGCGRRVS